MTTLLLTSFLRCLCIILRYVSKHFGELPLLLKWSPPPLLLVKRWFFHCPRFMYPISNLSLLCLLPHCCYFLFMWDLLPWKEWERSRMQKAYTWLGMRDVSSAPESACLSPGLVSGSFSTVDIMSVSWGPGTEFLFLG